MRKGDSKDNFPFFLRIPPLFIAVFLKFPVLEFFLLTEPNLDAFSSLQLYSFYPLFCSYYHYFL